MELFKLLGRIAVDNSEANRAIDDTVSHVQNTESRLGSTLKKIGGAVAAAFAVDKIKDFGQACVDVTAAVSAEQSAFEQIMGGYSDTAKEKMGEVADATGMVDSRLTTYMTSMTAKFKGLGYDVSDSTDLAQRGLTLAADSAAFWDKSLDESMSHLNSFINGSYEGGEAIGLFANDTQMAAYAVEKGLVAETKEWSKLDESIKQATRLEYAENMQKASGAVGQAAKESGQYANVQANLTEKWRQFKAQIGEPILKNVVLPGMEKLSTFITKTLSPGFEKLRGWVSKNKDMFIALKDRLFDVAKFLSDTFSPVLSAIKDIFKAVRDAIKPFIDRLLDFIETGEDTSGVLEILKDALQFVADVLVVVCEKIAEFIEWVSGGSQEAEAFKDVILVLATGFATYKGIMLALTIAQKAQTAATWAMEAAHKALNAVSPFGWVMLAVTALGALATAIVAAEDTCSETYEEYRKLTEEEQKLRDETVKLTDSFNNWKTSRDEAIANNEQEFGYYEDLWNELQGIVDQNGKIKEGYEARATFITEQLGDITGTEIEIIDGVIQTYGNLGDAIMNSIKLEQTRSMVTALEDDYRNALAGIKDAEDNMIANQQLELDIVQEALDAKQALEDFKTIYAYSQSWINSGEIDMNYSDKLRELQDISDALASKASEQINITDLAEESYHELAAMAENYPLLVNASVTGSLEDMEIALMRNTNDWRTHLTGTKEMLQEQADYYDDTYDSAMKAVKNGTNTMTTDQLIALGKMKGQAHIELKKIENAYDDHGVTHDHAYGDSLTAELGYVRKANATFSNTCINDLVTLEMTYGHFGTGSAKAWTDNFTKSIATYIPKALSSMGMGVSVYGPTRADIPNYEEFATGGIVTRETIARIGEDGPEAVVPLKNNTEWIDNVANRVANAVGRSDGTNVTYIFENVTIKSDSDIEEMAYKMEAMRQKAQLSQGGA